MKVFMGVLIDNLPMALGALNVASNVLWIIVKKTVKIVPKEFH